jgi:hypothetical protein
LEPLLTPDLFGPEQRGGLKTGYSAIFLSKTGIRY